MMGWRRASNLIALVACLWLHLAWAGEAYVVAQLPLWEIMDQDQKRCHLAAWLSGDAASFGDGRCESFE